MGRHNITPHHIGLPSKASLSQSSFNSVCVQRLQLSHSEMSLVLSLLMGTVVATALVVMAIMMVLRSNRKETKLEKRKTSHVTEVLQVDMVDRRLRSTSLDHSVEMDEMMLSNTNIRADDVLRPVSQIVTKIE